MAWIKFNFFVNFKYRIVGVFTLVGMREWKLFSCPSGEVGTAPIYGVAPMECQCAPQWT